MYRGAGIQMQPNTPQGSFQFARLLNAHRNPGEVKSLIPSYENICLLSILTTGLVVLHF
jgi:hypothetical protein